MKKVGIVFGGMSTENEVSKMSANSIIENIDKTKYEISQIYISKEGIWYKADIENMETNKKIENVMEYLKTHDVIFPVLHGLYGEDGTIQGLLELIKVPYVGCRVLASSVGMDKVYSKILFEKAGFNQAKYQYIRKSEKGYIYVTNEFEEEKLPIENIVEKVEKEIKYPMYVKPSNSGSSVGVKRVLNEKELVLAIEYAGTFDKKILIEEGINGRELECAILGNEELIVSGLGEAKPAEEFYSFDAKYNNQESKVMIPAIVDEKIAKEIQKLAEKAYRVVEASGLSRIDFFLETDTNKIYINEINTMPGFTNISMYPKLIENENISYKELISKLIELAIQYK